MKMILSYRVFIRRSEQSSDSVNQSGPELGSGSVCLGSDPIPRSELDFNTETVGDGLYDDQGDRQLTNEVIRVISLSAHEHGLFAPVLIDNRRPEWQDLRFDAATSQVLTAKVSDSGLTHHRTWRFLSMAATINR
jgi:hypothetical protein